MSSLQVGDVITYKFMNRVFKGVVIAPLKYTNACMVLTHAGDTILLANDGLTKTGEYIDIASILEKLKEE